MDNRVIVQVARPAPLLNGARRPFIEVFAGSCHLSQAFSKLGYQTFPIDVKINAQHDLVRQQCRDGSGMEAGG